MKNYLLFIFAVATVTVATAQKRAEKTIEITPKIGSSSFYERNTNSISSGNTSSNSGVAFGATVDYYLNNRWSLRSGLSFDKMGTGEQTNYGIINQNKLNYLSIPLNANWHFGPNRKWNLNFGFSPSFLLDASNIKNNVATSVSNDDIKSFQLGLTYGIGYKFAINDKFGILIDLQYFNGLTNTSKKLDSSSRNNGTSINVGGVFKL